MVRTELHTEIALLRNFQRVGDGLRNIGKDLFHLLGRLHVIAVAIELSEGSETVEGVLPKPISFNDEQLFLTCCSLGLELGMTDILDDIVNSVQANSKEIRWYRSGVQDRLAKIASFSSPLCADRLDVPRFLDVLIRCSKFKS